MTTPHQAPVSPAASRTLDRLRASFAAAGLLVLLAFGVLHLLKAEPSADAPSPPGSSSSSAPRP